MSVTREQLLHTLHTTLEAEPAVLAAWEAGSAAFGAADGYSDIDLAAIASDEADLEALFAKVEAALGPIDLRYHTPQPAWHGHAQRFYHVEGASPFLMVDLCFMRAGARDHFLEPRRHGRARVLFDRGAYVRAPEPDPEAIRAQIKGRLAVMVDWFALCQPVVKKEVLRGRAVDALHFYQALTLRPLVEALRMLHCPWRHDFALRYLERDLPWEAAQRVERLAFVADLADLSAKQQEAEVWFAETVAAIDPERLAL